MPRQRRGRSVHGWLLIDKPSGMTSSAVVGRLRWLYQAKKAGHAGTLDPAATGLLAIAFGEATKTIPYVADGEKTYRFSVKWGASTSTDDAEGVVLERQERRPTADEIRAALSQFSGDIWQVPPAVSAVKLAGRRAYDIARSGENPELSARPLHVSRLELIEASSPDTAVLEMDCGKGGYVRSIARDLGQNLGCLGHVQKIRRLRSGYMRVEDAIALSVLENEDRVALDAHLAPVAYGLSEVECLDITEQSAMLLRHGGEIPLAADEDPTVVETIWTRWREQPIAICERRDGVVRPLRVFNHG